MWQWLSASEKVGSATIPASEAQYPSGGGRRTAEAPLKGRLFGK